MLACPQNLIESLNLSLFMFVILLNVLYQLDIKEMARSVIIVASILLASHTFSSGCSCEKVDESLLRNLGGNGPYVSYPTTVINSEIPGVCTVDQVITISRHAERYPTIEQYEQIVQSIAKLKLASLSGPLQFIADYGLFMSKHDIGQLTASGPFSGTATAEKWGSKFAQKYHSLFLNREEKLRIFAGGNNRDIQTAENFAKGCFGPPWSNSAVVVSVPESVQRGANSLSPFISCAPGQNLLDHVKYSYEFYISNLLGVVDRLQPNVGRTKLDGYDVDSLFLLCAYELNAKGNSDFCSIFTPDEFRLFDYHASLTTYYLAGPGSSKSRAIGSPFVNASLQIFNEGPPVGTVFAMFAHDLDLQAILSTLGLFDPPERLPHLAMPEQNPWNVTSLTPMGARLVFERMWCPPSSMIRVLLNDAVIPIPGCDSGPGMSCELKAFNTFINSRLQSYSDNCHIPSAMPNEMSFLIDDEFSEYGSNW
ncbi:repressible acid phosphatase [Trichomonascus vanleenenianus]|uniref:histidine phosphatase family protein n=1 Tax=Trichomonascus vanleenenianus TaxID=2268995 RepID=UPI003ECB909F